MDWMTIIVNLLPLVPAPGAGQATVLAQIALELIQRIKSQSNMTTEQILERAGLTLEKNKLMLLEDMERLGMSGLGGGPGSGGGNS
ncbi:MAG: hypothetical protein ABW250_08650 [Pyrinomonadaceae bacterium]